MTVDEQAIKERFHEFFRVQFPVEPHVREDGTVDVDGSLDVWTSKKTITWQVRFNRVTKAVAVREIGLENLDGAPAYVGWSFDCSINNIKSLKGGPIHVGRTYSCDYNDLENLIGAPLRLENGTFTCIKNKLTSLEGAPQYIKGDFDCSDNPTLKSLVGGPREVIGGTYMADQTGITSLEGCPQELDSDLSVAGCSLISFKGAPRRIGGRFWATGNPLQTLDGLPEQITSTIHLTYNSSLPLMRLLSCRCEMIDIQGPEFASMEALTAIMNKWNKVYHVNKNKAMLGCQAELVKAGYAQNARW